VGGGGRRITLIDPMARNSCPCSVQYVLGTILCVHVCVQTGRLKSRGPRPSMSLPFVPEDVTCGRRKRPGLPLAENPVSRPARSHPSVESCRLSGRGLPVVASDETSGEPCPMNSSRSEMHPSVKSCRLSGRGLPVVANSGETSGADLHSLPLIPDVVACPGEDAGPEPRNLSRSPLDMLARRRDPDRHLDQWSSASQFRREGGFMEWEAPTI
jgi:hypothetical protein